MKKILPALLVLVAGIVCLFAIFWPAKTPQRLTPVRAPADTPVSNLRSPTASDRTPPTPGPDRVAQALLAGLSELLLRPDARPNEAILRFKDDAALARFLARAGASGLTLLDRLDALRSVRIHYDDLRALQRELLANSADYEDLSGNLLVTVPRVPAREARAAVNQVPFANSTLAFLGATGDRSQWGRGITVAVIDTGVGADVTFGSGRVSALDIGLGTAPGKGAENGHGTSVASLAAGSAADAAGVAPAANVLSIRVTDDTGTSDTFTIAKAIMAAVDAGAKVINVSMGGYGTNSAMTSAITYAQNHDAVIVAAAGNDQAAELSWPAADVRVISVGAVDKAEQQVTFSNSGPQLKLSAPGYGVQTAWLDGTRAYVDGTSASAPLVSGAIAALMSQNPDLSARDAAQRLTATANDAGAPGADPAFGYGILNLGWAMNASNSGYVDTAVASHYYNPATQQLQFVVQNRSGDTVSGMSLDITVGKSSTTKLISNLSPGASEVVSIPVPAGVTPDAPLRISTVLANPPGLVDQVPANNRRTSVLTRNASPTP